MNSKISCTYIGHATVFIQMGETGVLTDPHFGKYTFIFKRFCPVPIKLDKIPTPSCILISHTHCDHLDIGSYKFISCKVPIIVPEGCHKAIAAFVPNPTVELSRYADYVLPDGTKITALPSKHRTGVLPQCQLGSINSYLIRKPNGATVFFCGDSGFGPHFSEAANLANIDIALLPIGSYAPRCLMKNTHMNPAEAVQAFGELKAKHMIPIHHGTFRLSLENPSAPAKWLGRIVESRCDLNGRIHTLKAGETYDYDQGANQR